MLSKSAKSVQDALAKKGLQETVIELPASTRTANEAALAIGCEVAAIVKSLIFRTQKTHQAVLVLASGVNRVNEQRIAEVVGEPIEKADAAFTREVAGFAIGGIPPIGHKTTLNTIIDKDLLLYPVLWAAAGTPNAVFSLPSAVIKELTGGIVISVK